MISVFISMISIFIYHYLFCFYDIFNHIQSHLEKIPSGLDPIEMKAMERRRKVTVKTMEAMSVLDIAAGAMEQEETEDMSAAAERRSKKSM